MPKYTAIRAIFLKCKMEYYCFKKLCGKGNYYTESLL